MKLKHSAAFLLLMFSAVVYAVESPVVMLQATANKVIRQLNANRANLKSNPTLVYNIVNRTLIPQVDVSGMSRSVLGPNAWRSATPSQRQRFGSEFTKLVVRTYSSPLAEFTNEQVKFLPIRGGYQGRSRVQVNSIVMRNGAPNIPLSYRVVNTGRGWKVYDMSVEGVSLLQSFRSQFAQELSRGSLEQLIQRLQAHNAGARRR